MLSLKNSLKVLRKTNALLEGHFVLSSGLHSPIYIQCAKVLSHPHLASKLCLSLSKKIKKKFKKIDLILAPAIGGIVIGYEIGRLLKIETIDAFINSYLKSSFDGQFSVISKKNYFFCW